MPEDKLEGPKKIHSQSPDDRIVSEDTEDAKEHSQVSATLKWLDDNYERADGVCLPRCVLYTHYLDFCKKNDFVPAGAATFGKTVRQTFPYLTTRRLGTRGQSKYHYYGIGIKTTSVYYHSMYSGRGLSRFSENTVKNEAVSRKYSLSSKSGTLLPDFPTADSFVITEDVPFEKLETFLMMYRTHCQRVLDTIVTSNFEEVQNFLLHFWQGMPKHILPILSCDVIVDIIVLCDNILYKVLVDVLIPSAIQDLPDALSVDIRALTRKLPSWLESSLENIPDEVRTKKLKAVKAFVRSLKRHTSFIHLAQTSKGVLLSHDTVSQMSSDLADVKLPLAEKISDMLSEFAGLLNKQAPLQAYIEWIDSIIDRCVLQLGEEKPLEERAADFMLKWAFYTSKLVRDLTLHSAISFGSFHLLSMTLSEYALLVLEGQQDDRKHRQMEGNVQKHMKRAEEISTKAKLRKGKPSHTTSESGYRASKRKLSSAVKFDKNSTSATSLPGKLNVAPKRTKVSHNETRPYTNLPSHQTELQYGNHSRDSQESPTSPDYHESSLGYNIYARDAQTEHPSVRYYQEHPIITSGLTSSYSTSHKPRYLQDRSEPQPPYYPYGFHPTYPGGRGVYWSIEDPAGQGSGYQEPAQLHNISVNYHCDYGSSLTHHRVDGTGQVSPYYRSPYDESTRQFYPGDSAGFYGSRQYSANANARYSSTTVQPAPAPSPIQPSVEMLTHPRSALSTPSTSNGYMEIASQAVPSSTYEHAPHYGLPVCRDERVPAGNYAGYYAPKSRAYLGPSY